MIDIVKTSGVFSLDGEDFDVENNVFLVGDDNEVLVIDPAHDDRPIAEAIGDRRLIAIAATHAHNDHINAAEALSVAFGAPILVHPDDLEIWRQVYPDRVPDSSLRDGDQLVVGSTTLEVLHTPGHTPGCCVFYDRETEVCFSGDTLFKGGPGATGRRYSDFPTIIDSIRRRLLVLPQRTRVLPGHGDETTIGEEALQLEEWIARGY
ncbi:MAG TPA: MBL fold metallo-hydrolase [Acidimicrobiales bacterium]|nr:MBL fold metallo-hydrolase [Acidimicrobiales bacterium]